MYINDTYKNIYIICTHTHTHTYIYIYIYIYIYMRACVKYTDFSIKNVVFRAECRLEKE